MVKKRKKRRRRRIKPINDFCYFCKKGKEPDWKDYSELADFLSPRSRILSRERSGICVKHQPKLAKAIKHARHLGLLPFVKKVKV